MKNHLLTHLKMRKIMFMLLGILIIPLVIGSTLIYKQNTQVDIKVPCTFDGHPCSSAAYCNLTLKYPNGTYYINNQVATNLANGEFNYTLPRANILGDYDGRMSCSQSGNNGTEVFTLRLTPSGADKITSGEGIGLVISLIVMILVCIFLFVMSMRIQSPFGKFALIVLASIFLLIIVLYSVVSVEQTLGVFSNIVEGYSTFYFVLKILASLAVLALVLFSILVVIRYYKFKRGLLD